MNRQQEEEGGREGRREGGREIPVPETRKGCTEMARF